MNIKRFELDSDSALDHFKITVDSSNELSRSVFELNLKRDGCFFTILPSEVNVSHLHMFAQGGMASNLKKEIVAFISKRLSSNKNQSLIFDDVSETYENLIGYELFDSNGIYYKNEAYYLVQSTKYEDFSLLEECLRASDAEWHCLGLLTSANCDGLKDKELTRDRIVDICAQASMILTTSYDGEGYIFWEKYST